MLSSKSLLDNKKQNENYFKPNHNIDTGSFDEVLLRLKVKEFRALMFDLNIINFVVFIFKKFIMPPEEHLIFPYRQLVAFLIFYSLSKVQFKSYQKLDFSILIITSFALLVVIQTNIDVIKS